MANAFARHLRRNLTDEERILWSQLRRRQLMGLRFRRQAPVGPYVVDFVCLEHRFIVEIDGLQHDEPDSRAKDTVRTAWLESLGFRIFRAWNGEIRDNLNGVMESMLGEMGLLDAPMVPLPIAAAARGTDQETSAFAAPPSGATRHLPRKGGGKAETLSTRTTDTRRRA